MLSDLPQSFFFSRTTQITISRRGVYGEGQSTAHCHENKSKTKVVHSKHRISTCEVPPGSLHSAHQANFREWGIYLDFLFFISLLMYEILCMYFACRGFFTHLSVRDSIDGLFKVLKLCWLGKCLWWTIKFPATPPALFSLLPCRLPKTLRLL